MPQTETYYLDWRGPELPVFEEITEKMAQVHQGDSEAPASMEWERILVGGRGTNWPTHQEDMARLSENWPHNLFRLTGIGENPDNRWREYYLNGKVQKVFAQITYPEFDLMQLKRPEIRR